MLINNLLNWSRSQRESITFEPEKLLFDENVNNVLSIAEPVAREKNISIHKHYDASLSLIADQDLLSTTLTNLITNAIKFTYVDGEVSIEAKKDNQNVRISVIDNGVGISDENLKKLFDLKESFSTRGTGNEKGTGLGLMVCKDFVELHGGAIKVESTPEKGSRFTFSIHQK